MRPWRSTAVASNTSRLAPELARLPRWVRCQSVMHPSRALYWHMGEITTRLGSSSSAIRMGLNRALVMRGRPPGGRRQRARRARGFPVSPADQARSTAPGACRPCVGRGRHPDHVPGAAAAPARAHRYLVDRESGPPQALREAAIRSGGPYGKDAARAQRAAGLAEAGDVVEAVVGLARQPLGPVVDVEQDGVVGPTSLRHQAGDITFDDADPRVRQAIPENG